MSDLPTRAESIVESNAALEEEVDRLRDQLLEERLETLSEESVSKSESEWVIGDLDIDGAEANDVSGRVRALAGEVGDVVALTGGNGSSFVVVGTTGDPDASEIVDDVAATFGGGGGATFAQGGGFDEEPSAVADYLRERA